MQFRLDGQDLGSEDTSAPYSVPWNTAGVGNGTHTLTAIARDGAGNSTISAPVSVSVANTAPVDTTPPTVSMPSPSGGSTVSGQVALTASASDNVGVAGVQFKVDGQSLGGEASSSPYSVTWNTTTVADGSHVLTVVARDAAGNTKTSAPVPVTVANAVDPPADPPAPPVPSNPAPAISRLKLSAAAFSKGTTISFNLSEAAKVTLSFERRMRGHKVRGKCVAPAKKARPKCTRYSAIRTTLKLQGKAGANSMYFKGRLSRTRVLAPGRYRLTLLATDAEGKRSAPATTSFRLKDAAIARRALRSVARLLWR